MQLYVKLTQHTVDTKYIFSQKISSSLLQKKTSTLGLKLLFEANTLLYIDNSNIWIWNGKSSKIEQKIKPYSMGTIVFFKQSQQFYLYFRILNPKFQKNQANSETAPALPCLAGELPNFDNWLLEFLFSLEQLQFCLSFHLQIKSSILYFKVTLTLCGFGRNF